MLRAIEFNIEDAKSVWREEAREEGIEIGIAKGIAKGEARGIAKGEARGMKKMLALWEKGVPLTEAKRKLGIRK